MTEAPKSPEPPWTRCDRHDRDAHYCVWCFPDRGRVCLKEGLVVEGDCGHSQLDAGDARTLVRFVESIAKQPCYRSETEAGGCAPCEAQSLLDRMNITLDLGGHP